MVPILLYHAFKATTPFVGAFVNELLRQLLPSTNDCLLQFSNRRKNCGVGVTLSKQTIMTK